MCVFVCFLFLLKPYAYSNIMYIMKLLLSFGTLRNVPLITYIHFDLRGLVLHHVSVL